MAGKAEASMNPAQKLITTVRTNPQCGMTRLNGAAPSIDAHITGLRP